MFPYAKYAIKNLFSKPVTSNFPKESVKTAEKYRGKLKFNSDLCIGCGMCIRVCSPGAIKKIVKNIDDGQEITMEFNMGSCTFCGMCSDFCAKHSIELTSDCEIVAKNKEELIVSGTFVKKVKPKLTPEQIEELKKKKSK